MLESLISQWIVKNIIELTCEQWTKELKYAHKDVCLITKTDLHMRYFLDIPGNNTNYVKKCPVYGGVLH